MNAHTEADPITQHVLRGAPLKKTYTFVLDDGTRKTFDDPDDGVGWYMAEAGEDTVLVEIEIGQEPV